MRAFLVGLVGLLFALAVHLLEAELNRLLRRASGGVALPLVDRRL